MRSAPHDGCSASGFRLFSHLSGLHASCGGAFALVEHVSEHVVGNVGHADLHSCPADADGPDEEFEPLPSIWSNPETNFSL